MEYFGDDIAGKYVNDATQGYIATTDTTRVAGTVYFTRYARKNLTGGNLDPAINWEYAEYTGADITGKYVQTAGSTKFKRYAEINAGADWTVYEKVMLEGTIEKGATKDDWLAKLTINEGSNFVIKNNENGNPGNAARILFYGANNLILNKENAIVDEKGEAVKLATVGGYAFNKMTINANQVFKTLFLGKQADLDIVLADGVKLTFESFNTSDKSSYLHIYNFQEDSVLLQYVSNVETIENQIKLYGATADDFLGFAKVNDAGFLTLITVPEPAEWAMIFGALALGLAVYRKRR